VYSCDTRRDIEQVPTYSFFSEPLYWRNILYIIVYLKVSKFLFILSNKINLKLAKPRKNNPSSAFLLIQK